MRLIDADSLIKRFEGLRDEHETHSISYNALYEVLVQQPTAYDVEKVVEEMEGLKKPPFIDTPYHTGFICGVNYSIDIVKRGGVK